MEILSDVLGTVRLTGAVFFDIEAVSPWVAHTPPAREIAKQIMPDSQHVMGFHAILSGTCWVEFPDNPEYPALQLSVGDVIVLPRGERHLTASAPGLYREPDLSAYYRPADHPLPFVRHKDGGGTERARLACGYLGCDTTPYNPVLDALPPIIHAKNRASSTEWMGQLIRTALDEGRACRAGSEIVLARLSELLFVEVLRSYYDSLPSETRGWFAGLRDRHIGAALRVMHAHPARNWTLEMLAREVGLSRSAFADRFTTFLGIAPMQYLGRWRLQLAVRLLERPGASIAEVARDIGYETEAAFSRAFKKLTGVPPGLWRKQRRIDPRQS